MITPTMYLLSCYDKSLSFQPFLSIRTLTEMDRVHLHKEIDRIGSILTVTAESTGPLFPSDLDNLDSGIYFNSIDGGKELSPYTLAILYLLHKAWIHYRDNKESLDVVDSNDLGDDETILSIERNVNNAYRAVIDIMTNTPKDRRAYKLSSLYEGVKAATNQDTRENVYTYNIQSIQHQGNESFWMYNLSYICMSVLGVTDLPKVSDVTELVSNELSMVGIPGYTNPVRMLFDQNSRISRKTYANIDDEVLEYLDRARLSESEGRND